MTYSELKLLDWSKYGIKLLPKQIIEVLEWNKERELLSSFSFLTEMRLMKEESKEFTDGLFKSDLHEIIDALNDKQVVFIGTVAKYLLNGLNEEEDFSKEQIETYIENKALLMSCIPNMVKAFGFEPICSFNETLLEIYSRVGSINPETGKWEKDKSKEARSKWYKANYDLCQLKKSNTGE